MLLTDKEVAEIVYNVIMEVRGGTLLPMEIHPYYEWGLKIARRIEDAVITKQINECRGEDAKSDN